MTTRPTLLALLSVITACLLSSTLCAQSGTKFDPNKIKPSFFDGIGDEHEFDGTDGNLYRVKNTAKEKGLYRKFGGRWKRHGTFFRYSKKDIVAKDNFESGKREGKAFAYFKNGEMKQMTPYENGKIEGLQIRYNKFGIMQWSAEYENGKREGLVTQYYSAKKDEKPVKQFTEEWSDNLRNGETLKYDRQGKLVSRTMYINGEQDGETEQIK